MLPTVRLPVLKEFLPMAILSKWFSKPLSEVDISAYLTKFPSYRLDIVSVVVLERYVTKQGQPMVASE